MKRDFMIVVGNRTLVRHQRVNALWASSASSVKSRRVVVKTAGILTVAVRFSPLLDSTALAVGFICPFPSNLRMFCPHKSSLGF